MIIDGKQVAKVYLDEVREAAKKCKKTPHLVAIIVGNNPASLRYVNRKKAACESACMQLTVEHLYSNPKELEVTSCDQVYKDIEALIWRLNQDRNVHGILLQLPLPKGVQVEGLLKCIDPKKDVDGLNPENLGKLLSNDTSGFIPCTPLGILRLLEAYDIQTSGKRALIIGRSQIVGTPLSILLSRSAPYGNATVTLAHSKTPDIKELAQSADILIVAAGKKGLVDASWVKPKAILIDVGINEGEALASGKKRLYGDIDFENAKRVAGAITPVPGGVGPMTIASLLTNTLRAYEMSLNDA